MYACYTLVSHREYADGTDRQTDGRTPDRYITLSVRRGQRSKLNKVKLAAERLER